MKALPAAISLLVTTALAAAQSLTVTPHPAVPFVERRAHQQFLNFDLLIANPEPVGYTLIALKLAVYNSAGQLQLRRELNRNGHPPALDLVAPSPVPSGHVIDVFEPFTTFDDTIDLARLELTLLFNRTGHPAPPIPLTADKVLSLTLHPRAYASAPFCLPLRGLLLVHDGHDFYSHHRRYDLARQFQSDPATAVNANLYAYDLVATNPDGELLPTPAAHGNSTPGSPTHEEPALRNPALLTNWPSYGLIVYAPASGTVIEAVSDLAENHFDSAGNAQSPPNADQLDPSGLGNHITLRHPDGRVSWLLHLQPHSLTAHPGDHVRAGQPLAKVGFSGDSLFPHLHYTVTDSIRYPSQGVPSTFRNVSRLPATHPTTQNRTPPNTPNRTTPAIQIDTGDLIQTTACPIP